MMRCEGKCYLTKKLKDQEKQDHSPITKVEKFDIQPFYIPQVFSLRNINTAPKHLYFNKDEKPVSSYSQFIFHPPVV